MTDPMIASDSAPASPDPPLTAASHPAAKPMSRGIPGLFRWLYTQNPFYIISADLVFLGLRGSFDPGARDFDTGALIAGLAGYTVLLAATACLLIRFGRVWDDVRSILLLVVMMFLAISVSFDEILVIKPKVGAACFAGGLVFAIAVSELLLRGIRLRLPALFRVPYHLGLALFFLYPIALVPFRDRPEAPAAYWAVFGFSPLAGLVALTLLPAVWRGRGYLRGNGSPWRWPMYPWSLFFFLGLGVIGRSWYLCTSMHGIDAVRTIFGPFFWIPFGLAVAVVVLEIGREARSAATVRVALAMPLALAGLGLVGHRGDSVYRSFQVLFHGQLGCTPAFAALWLALAFYLVAMARRIGGAWAGLLWTLAALAVVGPDTLRPSDLVAPQSGPLFLLAALQAARAVRERSRGRAGFAMACLSIAVVGLPAVRDFGHPVLVGFHLMLGLLLVLGVFDDELGEFSRGLAFLLISGAIVFSTLNEYADHIWYPAGVYPAYPSILGLVALAYGRWNRRPGFFVPAGLALLLVGGTEVGQEYARWRGRVVGLDRIALGLASFAVAALISVRKAGYRPDRWVARVGRFLAPPRKPEPVDDLAG